MNSIKSSTEYLAIKKFYGKRRAKRSGVFLINHIEEGLEILRELGVSVLTKKAYCIHPLLQGDTELRKNRNLLKKFDSQVVALVVEYRNIANAYLSHRKVNSLKEIALSPWLEVNQMLVADKIQNFKDFMKYHYRIHPRSKDLFQYFQNWFKRLKIPSYIFKKLQEDSSKLPVLNRFRTRLKSSSESSP